jgi:glyoxylase I family protein
VCEVIARGINHLSLTIEDLPAAQEFYGGLLGLPEIERPNLGIGGVWYQAGAVQLHLIELPESMRPDPDDRPAKPAATPLANHLAFEIDDYEAVKARLEEAGYVVQGLGAKAGQLFIQDPQGNMVEFIRPGGRVGRVERD